MVVIGVFAHRYHLLPILAVLMTAALSAQDGSLPSARGLQYGPQQLAINATAPIFVTAPTYLTETQPRSIAVGDFNGDGNPDMAVANQCGLAVCATGSVSVLLGNGDGTFQPAVNYAAGAVNSVIVLAKDVNGDGKADLIVLSQAPTGLCQVDLLLANADGTFQPAINLNPRPNGVLALALGDFNRDGKVDMAVIDGSGVTVLSGNGDGSFLATSNYPLSGAESVVVGDMNGDGKFDLVVASAFSTSVLLGNGDGTFQAVTNDGGAGPLMVLGDFNGDGKQDVIFAGSLSMEIRLGNGDGTLQPGLSSPWPFFGSTIMVAGDFNKDGKQDLAVTSDCGQVYDCATESVSLLLGNGDGTFQAPRTYAAGSAPGAAVATADLNNDGNLDLVVAGFGSPGSASALLGNGDGTFRAPVDYAAGSSSSGGVVGDFNADGNLDLAVTSGCGSCGPNGSVTSVLLGNGDGTFQPAANYPVQELALSIATGDFNGDGIPDLVTTNACGNSPNCAMGSASVLLGKGDGTFQPAVNYPVQYAPFGVAVGDFNGDGKVDLAIVNSCTSHLCGHKGSVSILFGNGDGTFQPAINRTTGTFGISLLAGDFNGDGKADLAIVSSCSDESCTSGEIAVWLGRGNGSFNETNYLTPSGPTYVAAGDLNGDGKTDLVVTLSQCSPRNSCPIGMVNVLLGNGNGTFQPPLSFPVEFDPLSVVVEDFNGDGKLDVMASAGGTLMLLLGNGDGTLQSPTNFVLPSGHSLVTGDFNHDGKPDLAVDGAGVAILLNTASNFRYTSTVSLSSSTNPSYGGQLATFTAIVHPNIQAGALGGSVVFSDGSTTLGAASVSHGQATLSTAALTIGTHEITARYSGNSKYLPEASAPVTQKVVVAPTTTALTSNANPAVDGQRLTLTANVSSAGPSAPTGKVRFSDGSIALGIATVNGGVATLTKSTLAVGTHSIKAEYFGDAVSAKSTSPPLTQVVN
jgi:hypothetical protein